MLPTSIVDSKKVFVTTQDPSASTPRHGEGSTEPDARPSRVIDVSGEPLTHKPGTAAGEISARSDLHGHAAAGSVRSAGSDPSAGGARSAGGTTTVEHTRSTGGAPTVGGALSIGHTTSAGRTPHIESSAAWRLPPRGVFFAVSATFLVVFIASGTPVPLYNTYRVEDGISNSGLALATVAYLTTTALSLLLLGRLSDYLGRRPVAIGAAVSALAGVLIFSQVHVLPLLIAGRILQGLACGVASATLGTYVIDTAPPRPAWLPGVLTSVGPSASIPVGALISGVLAQYAPAPRHLIYFIVAACLVICIVLLTGCPDSVQRTKGALGSLRPQIAVPAGKGRIILTSGACLVTTWSFSAFYQAFAPAITADHLGSSNPIAIAAVFASIVILGPIGGSLVGRLRASSAIRLGVICFAVLTVVIMASLFAGAIVPFLGLSLVGSLCLGAANSGAIRAVVGDAAPAARAGLLSTMFLISYSGAAVPALLAGNLALVFSVNQIGACYVVLAVLCAVVALIAGRGQSTDV